MTGRRQKTLDKKLHPMVQTDKQTDRQKDGHLNYKTGLAQGANLVKTYMCMFIISGQGILACLVLKLLPKKIKLYIICILLG